MTTTTEQKPAISSRSKTIPLAIAAGFAIAASVPPWGWWPLAFVGFALVDQLLKGASAKARFGRMWLVTVAWMYPAMLWMFDLTAPGYVAVVPFFGVYFGTVAAFTPSTTTRRLLLPGAIALAEWARWSWPFGGVPLAHIALGQVNSPLGQTARVLGPLLVVMLVVVVGQALSSLADKQWKASGIGAAVCLAAILAAYAHPRATNIDEIDVALAQGGGPQRTRASADQEPVVLARHIETTKQLDQPVDLIVWPENVVNPGSLLNRQDADQLVRDIATAQDAPVLAGWFYAVSDTETVNYHSVINPDGTETDRYDKVRLVPFGEFVPLRSIIELVNDEIPGRDVRVGTVEPVLDTSAGKVGVAISWEGYFEHRYRDAVNNGAEIIINPTNGSSYWLTQVQTQQVASNQLRAIETDRWVMQVAPTGMSAFIDPDGNIIQRTGLEERALLIDTVSRREGRTLASIVGPWPILILGAAGIVWAAVSSSTIKPIRRRFP